MVFLSRAMKCGRSTASCPIQTAGTAPANRVGGIRTSDTSPPAVLPHHGPRAPDRPRTPASKPPRISARPNHRRATSAQRIARRQSYCGPTPASSAARSRFAGSVIVDSVRSEPIRGGAPKRRTVLSVAAAEASVREHRSPGVFVRGHPSRDRSRMASTRTWYASPRLVSAAQRVLMRPIPPAR